MDKPQKRTRTKKHNTGFRCNECVVYMAGHPGFVNYSIAHRLIINSKKSAILIYGQIGVMKDNIHRLKETGVFDEVFYAFDTMGQLEADEVSVISKILTYYDRVFLDKNININFVDEFYVGVDTLNSYGIYLLHKGVGFKYFEGGGRNFFKTSKERVNSALSSIVSDSYKHVMDKMKISDGSNEKIICLVNKESDYSNYNIRTEIFDISNIANISQDKKNKLLSYYDVDESLFSGTADIVVMNSQWGIRDYSEDEQKWIMLRIYQLVADYYIRDAASMVIIKPHPLCRIEDQFFEKRFKVPVIPKIFPSEFMCLFQNLAIRNTYTLGSSGSYGTNCTKVGFSFYNCYKHTEMMHYALYLYKMKFKSNNLVSINISKEYVSNVASLFDIGVDVQHSTDLTSVKPNSFILVADAVESTNYDRISQLVSEQNCTFIFLNDSNAKQKMESWFTTRNLFLAVKLVKKRISNETIGNQNPLNIQIYTNRVNEILSTPYEYIQKIGGFYIHSEATMMEFIHPREMGQIYRDGKVVGKDLNIAAEWMRKAADQNAKWAKNELFDILWNINTPETHKEMIAIATRHAESGDDGAMARLGRAYRDGKGVEKNLDKAIGWMNKATESNSKWKKEFNEMLSKRGDLKDLQKLN